MKIRITSTLLAWFEESSAWTHTEGESLEVTRRLFEQMKTAGRRADGSITLDLDADHADELREWASFLADASRDGAGYDAAERGEYNAARALMRQIERGGAR